MLIPWHYLRTLSNILLSLNLNLLLFTIGIIVTRSGYHKRHERIGVEVASHNWEMFPLLAPNGGQTGVHFTIMG